MFKMWFTCPELNGSPIIREWGSVPRIGDSVNLKGLEHRRKVLDVVWFDWIHDDSAVGEGIRIELSDFPG